jgi:tRNA threonylcarbamoyladenosine modification (KEOPS) complex Cgi121 subunit
MKKGNEFFLTYKIYDAPSNYSIEELIEKIKLKDTSPTILQIIDPKWIVSEKQLKIAVYHTMKAFETKRNIARDKATEFLIRLSGRRQIVNAVELFGIRKESSHLLLIAFGGLDKENKQNLTSFAEDSKILVDKEATLSFPLSEIVELSEFYECQEELGEIEKEALESMAKIEIL